ncbi:hypothetical protein AMK20_28285 [Streptomyces sp. TSRI0261]|nr:hypothetical protein AMK20_28285 [Streptomyces sp. TSRI0261]
MTVVLGLATVVLGLVTATVVLALAPLVLGLLVVLRLPVVRPRSGSGRWAGFPRCGPVMISPS